ncbi:PAQR family membrane homeostasis protein TrhA [Dellaglioa sp. BT-FLS60]
MEQNYSRRYLILNEVLNAVTHGIGFGLSIAGLIVLIIKGTHDGSALEITSYAIYGSSLVLLYLTSTLFHSLIFTRARTVFQIFDHSSIYILIAGTYTPYCLIAVGGALGWTLFGIIWVMTILGIIYKSIWLGHFKTISTIIYLIMGWLCLSAMFPLYASLGVTGFWLLVSGGLAFTIGAGIYSINGVKYLHVVWHLFVMLGTGLMFFSILFYT